MKGHDQIVKEAEKFRKEANALLSKHETSVTRVLDMQKTLKQIASLNLKQQYLLDEAVDCIQHESFRAAHVIAWAAMADYLEEWLIEDKKGNLVQHRPNWNITSVEAMMEKTGEHDVIVTLRVCGYIKKNTEQSLIALLKRRNLCAHPTGYDPDLNMTVGFVSELRHWFSKLEKSR